MKTHDLEADKLGMMAQMVDIGLAGIGCTKFDSTRDVLGAVAEHISSTGASDDEDAEDLEDEYFVAMGAVVGDQFVKHLGWKWMTVDFDGDEDGEGGSTLGVRSADGLHGLLPALWCAAVADDELEENFLLTFNMVKAGNLPPSTPGEITFFNT